MEIATALSGLKTLVDAAKLALDARDDAKLKEALAGMSERLLTAYGVALETAEKNAQLQAALHALNHQHVQLESQLKQKEACTLVPLVPGSFAYKPSDQPGDRPQNTLYYCQNCYDRGVKSVLRYHASFGHANERWICAEEGTHSIFG